MTVLSGAEGVTQSLASLVAVAGNGLGVVKQLAGALHPVAPAAGGPLRLDPEALAASNGHRTGG